MQLKFLIYKLFFLMFTFFLCKNFAFGNSINKKNIFFNSSKILQDKFYKNHLEDLIFLKKKNVFLY